MMMHRSLDHVHNALAAIIAENVEGETSDLKLIESIYNGTTL